MANKIAIPPVNARRLTLVVPSMVPLETASCAGESAGGIASAGETRVSARPSAPDIWLEDLAFEFEVSSDEEYVRLHVFAGERSFDMGARAHNYLLLLLARARLADAVAMHRDSSCGWVYQDDFLRDPTLSDPQINVHIFRARRQFTVRGIGNGDHVIERRPQTRQLRIGASRITIVTR
jgi:hypothetical protein